MDGRARNRSVRDENQAHEVLERGLSHAGLTTRQVRARAPGRKTLARARHEETPSGRNPAKRGRRCIHHQGRFCPPWRSDVRGRVCNGTARSSSKSAIASRRCTSICDRRTRICHHDRRQQARHRAPRSGWMVMARCPCTSEQASAALRSMMQDCPSTWPEGSAALMIMPLVGQSLRGS